MLHGAGIFANMSPNSFKIIDVDKFTIHGPY